MKLFAVRPFRAVRAAAWHGSQAVVERLEERLVLTIYTVMNAADTGAGSFREAIANASMNVDPDEIRFDAGVFSTPQTIVLNSALPQMNGVITVSGPGSSLLTVQRAASGPTNSRRVFDSFCTVLNLSGMTVTGGALSGAGGAGLLAVGTGPNITVNDVNFTNNSTDSFGGAIYMGNEGTLAIRNSRISGNSAASGGGIFFFSDGALLMENCTVSGNHATSGAIGGGGIYFDAVALASPPAGFTPSTLVIRNSAIYDNTSVSIGGGITVDTLTGTLLVQNSTISGNTAAIAGGGIHGKGGAGTITLQDCTLTNNVASGSNGATAGGGGIARFSTLNNNLNITNSVVSGNYNTIAADIITDGFTKTQANFSAIGGSAGFTLVSASGNNIPFNTDLKLDILGTNGGSTKTHAILAGSPLIAAGSNASIPSGISTDQRGAGFPRISGNTVDIGAFERAAIGPTVLSSQFNFLTPPQSIQFTFSANVAASLSAADLVLKNLTTNTTLPAANIAVSYNTSNNIATFTFPGYSYGALPDGDYHATLAAASVTDAAQNPLTADATLDFFFLNGDANRDRSVGFADLVALAQNYGVSTNVNFAKGEFTYDGTVGFADLVVLAQKYGTTLPIAASAIFAASSIAPVNASPSSNKALFSVTPLTRKAPNRPAQRNLGSAASTHLVRLSI